MAGSGCYQNMVQQPKDPKKTVKLSFKGIDKDGKHVDVPHEVELTKKAIEWSHFNIKDNTVSLYHSDVCKCQNEDIKRYVWTDSFSKGYLSINDIPDNKMKKAVLMKAMDKEFEKESNADSKLTKAKEEYNVAMEKTTKNQKVISDMLNELNV